MSIHTIPIESTTSEIDVWVHLIINELQLRELDEIRIYFVEVVSDRLPYIIYIAGTQSEQTVSVSTDGKKSWAGPFHFTNYRELTDAIVNVLIGDRIES